MNRAKAKKEAQENTRTWGELKEIFDNASDEGMSVVNKSLTKKQVMDIFRGMFDSVDLSVVPPGMRYCARSDRMIMSGDALGIMNLLRECA
jgi:hypothetical protein